MEDFVPVIPQRLAHRPTECSAVTIRRVAPGWYPRCGLDSPLGNPLPPLVARRAQWLPFQKGVTTAVLLGLEGTTYDKCGFVVSDPTKLPKDERKWALHVQLNFRFRSAAACNAVLAGGQSWAKRRFAMAAIEYPEMITRLPQADIGLRGVRGWISQAADHQVVFLDIDPIGTVPPHSHGEQWGIVVEGEMELTIGGETRRYGPGDSYHIPAGTVHGAKFLSHFRAIDVFADRERYTAARPA